jgi:hypothetical protein
MYQHKQQCQNNQTRFDTNKSPILVQIPKFGNSSKFILEHWLIIFGNGWYFEAIDLGTKASLSNNEYCKE